MTDTSAAYGLGDPAGALALWVDDDGRVRDALTGHADLAGRPASAWVGHPLAELAHPDDRGAVDALIRGLVAEPGTPARLVLRTVATATGPRWLEIGGVRLPDGAPAEPTAARVLIWCLDPAPDTRARALQHHQQQALDHLAHQRPLATVLEEVAALVIGVRAGTGAGVVVPEGDTVTVAAGAHLPPAVATLLAGEPPPDEPHPVAAAMQRPGTRRGVAEGDPVGDGAVRIDTAALPQAWRDRLEESGVAAIWVAPAPQPADAAQPAGALVVIRDDAADLDPQQRQALTVAAQLAGIALQHRHVEQQLTYLARHDRLTGLANRTALLDEIDDAARQARARGTSVAVLCLDLDNFKLVNDSLGHSMGDQLLIRFARRLGRLVRPGDSVGRFGSDEFVMLVRDVPGLEEVSAIAERLREHLRQPFQIDDHTVFVSASIGIAPSRPARDSAEALLRDADSAVYQAKSRGRARIAVHDDRRPERATRRMALERDLHRALARDQFELHWQPKVDLRTGRIVSAEALLRWRHPQQGLLTPSGFVQVAEELELIDRIGEWVLTEAVREHHQWLAEHGDEAPASIAVNISALELSTPSVARTVAKVLGDGDRAAHRLVLELTETVFAEESAAVSSVLEELRRLGAALAIDDFGTGYSSLAYLHRFAVDQVKIDRSFVVDLRADATGSVIARAIIELAHALDISVTAEGVETDAQRQGLLRLGCDRGQGYLFAAPMPAVELAALMARAPRFATHLDPA